MFLISAGDLAFNIRISAPVRSTMIPVFSQTTKALFAALSLSQTLSIITFTVHIATSSVFKATSGFSSVWKGFSTHSHFQSHLGICCNGIHSSVSGCHNEKPDKRN